MVRHLIPPAYAQCEPGQNPDGINLSDCLLLNDSTPVYERYSNLGVLINLVVQNLFIVAGVILLFMIVYGGYQFIWKGKKGVEEARDIWTRAGIGIILMIAAYWIVQLVRYVTGADIIIQMP